MIKLLIRPSVLAMAFIALVVTASQSRLAAQDSRPSSKAKSFSTLTLKSTDGLAMTADLYRPHASKKTPFIVLFHQAGWSRGEYREIAPKLNAMGFNCLAVDQRSGQGVNGVTNMTAKAAGMKKLGQGYLDARQDPCRRVEVCSQALRQG